MKRTSLLLLCILLALCVGCESMKESSPESKYKPQINPYNQNTRDNAQSVTLYYPLTGEPYLSSYTATVDVHADTGDTLQDALMRELVKGPPQGLSLDAVFVDNLKKVSVQRNGSLMTVVLSKELLTLGEGSSSDSALEKQLVIYAIVNTLTGNGDIQQVQILVDSDNSGRGKVPNRSQVGFVDSDENELLGPLGFSNSWLLTPDAAAQIVLDAGQAKDANRMLRMLGTSVLLPDAAELENRLQTASVVIVDYYVNNVQMSLDNQQATVYVDITYELMNQSLKQVFSQPITLKQERGSWKVDYQSVETLLFP